MSNGQLCPACDGRSDDGLICPRCVAGYTKDLRAIPGLMRELETTLTRQAQTGTGNGGKGAEVPLPFDANASEVGDVAKNTLVVWVRTFQMGDDWPDDNPISICAWLHSRPQRIRGHEEAPEFIDEIADVVRQLRRAIDLRPEMVYLGPCPRIFEWQLGDDGEEHPVTCRHQMYARKRDQSYDCPGQPGIPCGAVYNVNERRNDVLILASDESATVGLCAQVLAMFGLPVRVDTIWNWVRPREIRGVVYPPKAWATGLNDRGEALYRIGDIETLVREALDAKEEKARRRAG